MSQALLNHEARMDLALAAELQSALLPRSCPTDCPHQVAAARNRMCGSVGGDFYDFIRLNDDQIALLIGDVVGHGVRSSLIMAQIMGFLRSQNSNRSRPSDLVAELNRMLIDLGQRTNTVVPCSLVYGVLDAPTGTGFFVNAGHPRPILCDKNSCAALSLQPHNMLLGVEEFEPVEFCLTLHAGQRLILHTDGLTDAVNEKKEFFGLQRLHAEVSEHAADTPQRCADAVFQAVAEFRGSARQSDDETIVVIDRI